ncbi:MAG: beta-galactosidase [Patescibacteria group bacterium]
MKKLFKIFGLILLVVLLLYGLMFLLSAKRHRVIWGVSFNSEYASYLGLKSTDVFMDIMDKWNFHYVRLSAQWDQIEKKKGEYDFNDLDWFMGEADKRGAKVALAVGQKVPRWPECHAPEWAKNLPDEEYFLAIKKFFIAVVDRYRDHPALEFWQIENEPFLDFGICRPYDTAKLKTELQLAKKIDGGAHPLMVTDSGELSWWTRTARATDLFGTTMYRVVWNKYLGYLSYDFLPPWFYRLKLYLNLRPIKQAYVMELQAEPWVPNQDIRTLPVSEQYKSMNLDQLKMNLDYARRAGLPRAYLWGAEWWAYLESKGYNEIPDFIKNLSDKK